MSHIIISNMNFQFDVKLSPQLGLNCDYFGNHRTRTIMHQELQITLQIKKFELKIEQFQDFLYLYSAASSMPCTFSKLDIRKIIPIQKINNYLGKCTVFLDDYQLNATYQIGYFRKSAGDNIMNLSNIFGQYFKLMNEPGTNKLKLELIQKKRATQSRCQPKSTYIQSTSSSSQLNRKYIQFLLKQNILMRDAPSTNNNLTLCNKKTVSLNINQLNGKVLTSQRDEGKENVRVTKSLNEQVLNKYLKGAQKGPLSVQEIIKKVPIKKNQKPVKDLLKKYLLNNENNNPQENIIENKIEDLDSFGNSRLKKFLSPEDAEIKFREESCSGSKIKNPLVETIQTTFSESREESKNNTAEKERKFQQYADIKKNLNQCELKPSELTGTKLFSTYFQQNQISIKKHFLSNLMMNYKDVVNQVC